MSASLKQSLDVGEMTINRSSAICRYHLRGICRFGDYCRFSHDVGGFEDTTSEIDKLNTDVLTNKTNIDMKSWANAPIFVPNKNIIVEVTEEVEISGNSNKVGTSWAQVVVGLSEGLQSNNKQRDEICPFESPCPFGCYCAYVIHMELCKMCDQYCLHPNDKAQRKKHNSECLQHHEKAMELSFAIARSKDKTCGICFDTIMEKSGREKRFGILPNCNHIYCLECIRKWRQAKQFDHKISRSCPECRVCSDFVCPSAFWVETKEEKDKLLNDYRTALGAKDCKYFKKGDGKCPFGNKCFYKHALLNGELVDVGLPKRVRKIHRNTDELIDLLDIYLWEFVDQRDYHWLDLLSSDASDVSDWADD